MKKLISIAFLLLAVSLTCPAQLKFNKEGKFKIAQFTDVHMKYGNPMSDVALANIDEILATEQPDLAVFTGDVVYAKPAAPAYEQVFSILEKHKVPFVFVPGNHDDEQDMGRDEIYAFVRKFKHNIQPEGRDFSVPVYASDGSGKAAAAVYCFDSNAYARIKDVGGYDWIGFDQVAWYRSESRRYTAANGGNPLPSLAFFHIPLPEFKEAIEKDGNPFFGIRKETVASPRLNSGLYTAMLTEGDVMGVFCGHDHDNDFTTIWYGMVLGYGRYSGGNTVYNNLSNGARIFELHEGKREFETWLRLRGGAVKDRTDYPASYFNDNWEERTEPFAPRGY